MILCIGDFVLDVYAEPSKDGFAMVGRAGGATFNVASNVALSHHPAGFYGVVGDDPFGEYLKNAANRLPFSFLRVDTKEKKRTTIAMVELKEGERSFSFLRDASADYLFKASALKGIPIHKKDIVCLGSMMLSKKAGKAFFKEAASYFRKEGCLIAFDVNHRDGLFESDQEAFSSYMECLSLVDILKLSEEEMSFLSSGSEEHLIRFFLRKGRLLLLSKGGKGSEAYWLNRNGGIEKVAAPAKNVCVFDTTGAGDAFFAKALSKLDGKDIGSLDERELRSLLADANEAGALATTYKGALPAF